MEADISTQQHDQLCLIHKLTPVAKLETLLMSHNNRGVKKTMQNKRPYRITC
jgi:hypothetical protein